MENKDEKRADEQINEPLETGDKAADAGQENAQEENDAQKMSWEEILEDAEYRACYDRAVQGIVQRRLRKRQEAESSLERLSPVFEALSQRYGIDPDPASMDAAAVAEMILEGLRKSAQDSEKLMEHLDKLIHQEAELKESFPDFDLLRELEDPMFLRLTAPHTGLGLADAYYALHRAEIGRAAAKESLEALSRSIRSGGARPREHSDSRRAHSFSPDPRTMSRAEREALKKRIYEAKAKGEKVYE